eukprot:scaffold1687_cov405-Prasinococcus_capsulatus_cf.AAC.37
MSLGGALPTSLTPTARRHRPRACHGARGSAILRGSSCYPRVAAAVPEPCCARPALVPRRLCLTR